MLVSHQIYVKAPQQNSLGEATLRKGHTMFFEEQNRAITPELYIFLQLFQSSLRLKKDIAERKQYPLKRAFGLTIHKAKGMTLNRYVNYYSSFMFQNLDISN